MEDFPEMSRESLVAIRKGLDGAYREFSRSYGDIIESLFDPLLYLPGLVRKTAAQHALVHRVLGVAGGPHLRGQPVHGS